MLARVSRQAATQAGPKGNSFDTLNEVISMASLWRFALAVPAAFALSSCGSSSTTTPTPTQANITVTLSPNPITAAVCSPNPCQSTDGRQFQWRVQGTVTIQETAGIGANVNSITVTAFNPQIVYGSDVIIQRSGTNHIGARGMLIFPLAIDYGLVSSTTATRQIVLPFVIQLTDDRGNQLTAVAQWSAN
jgi:hypothetical protein